MAAIISVTSKMELSRGRVCIFGQTGLDTRVNGCRMKWLDAEISTGRMAACLRANSRTE